MFEAYNEEEILSDYQKELLDDIFNTTFCIEDVCDEGLEEYDALIEKIKFYLSQGFEVSQFRKFPTKVKFRNNDSKTYVIQLRHFLTNLLFWRPIIAIEQDDDLDETYFVDPENLSAQYIERYVNNNIIIPYRKDISNKRLNLIISDLRHSLSTISFDYNMIMGLSLNLETFMHVAKLNKRFDEIIHTKLDPGKQPKENEELLNELQREQVRILRDEVPGNFLQPILKSGAGIKEKQLAEFSIAGGYKPDLKGITQPLPITGNFIVGGLGSIPNYFIDSTGGRKAAIMNNDVMGKAGWFARKLMLISTDVVLRKDTETCYSINGVQYEIKTKEHLKRLVGRYYIERTGQKFRVLKDTDTKYIGRKLFFKSPITCSSIEGICRECYGELFYTNMDLNSAGALSGTKTTNPISQNVLSTKHLLTTDSEEIVFNDEFYNFFNIFANDIDLLDNSDVLLSDYEIIFNEDDIKTVDEYDDTPFNNFVSIFYVRNIKTGEEIAMYEKKDKLIYLSSPMMDFVKLTRKKKNHGTRVVIPIRDIERELYKAESRIFKNEETKLFSLIIANNELTKPLYDIMWTLDKKGHCGCQTINQMAQSLLDLFIKSKIDLDAVHSEMLIRPLIRSVDNILKVPDFNNFVYNDIIPEGTPTKLLSNYRKDYEILTVSQALEKNPSALIGLAFECLERQLSDPTTYDKTGSSFLDPFFRECMIS